MDTNSLRPDNLATVAWVFIKALRVPVTRTSFQRVFESMDSEMSLDTLAHVLKSWKIEVAAVRLTSNQLASINMPAIVHLKASDDVGYFAMIQNYEHETVTYFDSMKGTISESYKLFAEKWEGVTLLAAVHPDSGETDYDLKRRQELLIYGQTWLPVVSAILGLIWCLLQPMTFTGLLLVLTKTGGFTASIFLLQQEYGLSTPMLDKFCRINRHMDCQAVLNSSAAKLFGWLGMAELGLIYFAGSLAALLIAAYAQTQVTVLPVVAFANLLTLPYTLFSVYYQARVVKKFCPLCLSVLGILWLELLIDHSWLTTSTKSYLPFSLLLLCFGFSLALWLVVKPSLELKDRLSILTKELARFRNNSDLFQALLHAGPAYKMNFEPNEVQLGNPNASVTLTMVSGAFCAPCKRAHQLIDELLEKYSDDLNIVIRFAVSEENPDDVRNQVAAHLLNVAATKPTELAAALEEWYQNQNLDRLQATYSAPMVASTPDLLAKQVEWMRTVGIQFTPTYFINDRRLPNEFTLADMDFQLRFLIKY